MVFVFDLQQDLEIFSIIYFTEQGKQTGLFISHNMVRGFMDEFCY